MSLDVLISVTSYEKGMEMPSLPSSLVGRRSLPMLPASNVRYFFVVISRGPSNRCLGCQARHGVPRSVSSRPQSGDLLARLAGRGNADDSTPHAHARRDAVEGGLV